MSRPDLSVVVAVHNGEEHIGRLLAGLMACLRGQRLAIELLVLDENSDDNTLAVLALLRRRFPEMEVLPGVAAGRGLLRGVELSRGRSVLLLTCTGPGAMDAIVPALLSLALSRLASGHDVVLAPPYLLVRRGRALPLLGQLDGGGRPSEVSRVLPAVRRRGLCARLRVAEVPPRRPQPLWQRLRALLPWPRLLLRPSFLLSAARPQRSP